MKIKVAIVEDDIAFRSLLETLLDLSSNAEVVACCSNAREALGLLPRTKTQVVLIATPLPGGGGADLVRRLKAVIPDLKIITSSNGAWNPPQPTISLGEAFWSSKAKGVVWRQNYSAW